MNYSMNARIKKQKERQRNLIISWIVCLVLGIFIGFLISTAVSAVSAGDADETIPLDTTSRQEPVSTITPLKTETPCSTSEPLPEPTEKVTSLGEFKLTAYCPCEKCCGVWGKNRPTDGEGNLLVKTASGAYAKEGVTVAADTSVLPFGTALLIDGHEYIVQDRGGAVNGNQIDIYFESHEEALQFGVQYMEIYIIERMNEND